MTDIEFRVEAIPANRVSSRRKWITFIDALRKLPDGQCAVIPTGDGKSINSTRSALYGNRALRAGEKIRIQVADDALRIWIERTANRAKP